MVQSEDCAQLPPAQSRLHYANSTQRCPLEKTEGELSRPRQTRQGEFQWTREEQGNILGSFFWGHVLTQVPGGILVQRWGPKWPLGLSILFTVLPTLLIPAAAHMGIVYLMAARVIMGLAGVSFRILSATLGFILL